MSTPYSRIYWQVMDDSKFDGIREDARLFGAWALLLIYADMAYPAPTYRPPFVPLMAFNRLVAVGLVDELPGKRYRIHGLASDREMRTQSARNAAAKRWQSSRINGVDARREEKRKEENTRGMRPHSTVDRDPELRAQRDAQVARYGRGMDEPPTPPGWKVKEKER